MTLRYAIDQAEANFQDATITFAPTMINLVNNTITLTTTDTDIAYGPTAFVVNGVSITIDGSDHPGLVISGGDTLRPFVVTATASMTLEDLTISGGLAQGGEGGAGGAGGGGGGGMGGGGGVYVDGGTFYADGVTFVNNTAQGGAGGMATGAQGTGGHGGGALGCRGA